MSKRNHEDSVREGAIQPEEIDDGTTDEDIPDQQPSDTPGLSRKAFLAKTQELAETMEVHEVSGYGNVLIAKDRVLALLESSGTPDVRMSTLSAVFDQAVPVKGVPRGGKVHNWLKQIVETGDCDYIAHIRTKHARRRRA